MPLSKGPNIPTAPWVLLHSCPVLQVSVCACVNRKKKEKNPSFTGHLKAWRKPVFFPLNLQCLMEMHHGGEGHAESRFVQKLHAEFTASAQAENSCSHRRGQSNRKRQGSVTQLQSGQQQNTHLWYTYCTHASHWYQLQDISRAGPGEKSCQNPCSIARLRGRQKKDDDCFSLWLTQRLLKPGAWY